MADGVVAIRNAAGGETGVEIIQASSPIDPPLSIKNAAGTILWAVNTNGNAFASRIFQNVRTITANGTAGATDSVILVDCTAGAVQLALTPAAQTAPGSSTVVSKTLTVIKIDTTANALTITRVGADTINGLTGIILDSFNQQVDLTSDGVSKWYTLPQNWNAQNNLINITTTYTIANGDYKVLCNATGGAFTVTLPSAASVPAGWEVRIEKIDAAANTVTVSRAGADTIEGATTVALSAQYNSVRLTSDGVGVWYKF